MGALSLRGEAELRPATVHADIAKLASCTAPKSPPANLGTPENCPLKRFLADTLVQLDADVRLSGSS